MIARRWSDFRCRVLRQHNVGCRGRADHAFPYVEWRGLRRQRLG